ncbi:MAG TPA: hypothetical protein DCF33_03765 [Saprospirales bacterium]|nr:hypothetical protein [Saprospirales bacterium]
MIRSKSLESQQVSKTITTYKNKLFCESIDSQNSFPKTGKASTEKRKKTRNNNVINYGKLTTYTLSSNCLE